MLHHEVKWLELTHAATLRRNGELVREIRQLRQINRELRAHIARLEDDLTIAKGRAEAYRDTLVKEKDAKKILDYLVDSDEETQLFALKLYQAQRT